jgi:2-dehydro-3-deoxygalactonokinase
MPSVEWIGAEVTTAGVQIWAVSGSATVLHRGQRQLDAQLGAEAALAELLAECPQHRARCPVLACDLRPLPDLPIPCAPAMAALPAEDRPGLWLLPGLQQHRPAERVRAGQALRLAGCLAAAPEFDGVVCLLGTQNLWAQISAGEVISVISALSSGAWQAMAQSPWLQNVLTSPGAEVFDPEAFDTELPQALSRPERLMRALSRAADLPPPEAAATLRAALIGAELAAARPWWLGQRVLLLGDGAPLYARALGGQGVPTTLAALEPALLAGFAGAAQALPR